MGGLNVSPKHHCFSATRNGCTLWTCKPGAVHDGTKTTGLKTHPCQPYEYDNLVGHLKGALGFLASWLLGRKVQPPCGEKSQPSG